MAPAVGAMIRKVSQVKGTSGRPKLGRPEGSSPMSATVWTGSPKPIDSAESTMIDTSGEGTAVVIRGKR